MVHHHRIHSHHLSNGDEEDANDELIYHEECGAKKAKPSPLRLIFLFSSIALALLLCCSISALRPLHYDSLGAEEEEEILQILNSTNGRDSATRSTVAISCDRTAFRTDICFMRGGDVRTHSPSNSIIIHSSSSAAADHPPEEERISPYPRKWEAGIMEIVPELRLRVARHPDEALDCNVRHAVPAVVFSTGGYTGNLYHDFNEVILPLYITTEHFNKRVVFVVLEYRNWWLTKYGDVLSCLSDYPPIDFSNDTRTHCFPEATVGLRIHGDLTVDADRMMNNRSIGDFRQMLDEAYRPRIRSLEIQDEEETQKKPKLVIVSRAGSRRIENEGEVVRLAEEVGFRVEMIRPERTTELAKIYMVLNSSDAMVGVHGAAMTHLLFMRPGSVLIQIVPLGTRWAAETYYGEPAEKMGLWYSEYRVRPEESSLYREYEMGDPVLRWPDNVSSKGWQVTKRVYLDGQNVRVDLSRFGKRLVRAHRYLVLNKHRQQSQWSWW